MPSPRIPFWKRLLRGPLPSSERYGKTNADGYTILDTEKLKKSPQFKTLVENVAKFRLPRVVPRDDVQK